MVSLVGFIHENLGSIGLCFVCCFVRCVVVVDYQILVMEVELVWLWLLVAALIITFVSAFCCFLRPYADWQSDAAIPWTDPVMEQRRP